MNCACVAPKTTKTNLFTYYLYEITHLLFSRRCSNTYRGSANGRALRMAVHRLRLIRAAEKFDAKQPI